MTRKLRLSPSGPLVAGAVQRFASVAVAAIDPDTVQNVAITVTGVEPGDVVWANPTTTIPADAAMMQPVITTDDEVILKFGNVDTAVTVGTFTRDFDVTIFPA